MRAKLVGTVRCELCEKLIKRDDAIIKDDMYYCAECNEANYKEEIEQLAYEEEDLIYLKKRDTITKEEYMAIKSAVLKHHGCLDSYTESDILFIIEYMLGFKNVYISNDDYIAKLIREIFY